MRHLSLDYFRVLCTLIVVFIHSMTLDTSDIYANGSPPEQCALCCLGVIFSISVPGFVLLSGAFNLNRLIPNARDFYVSALKKIGIYYLLFLIINFSVYKVAIPIYIGQTVDIKNAFYKCILKGHAGVEWFIPMIFGLYLLTPLILKIKERVSACAFWWITVAVLCSTHLTLEPLLDLFNCDLPAYFLSPLYLGLYMLGGCMFRCYKICNTSVQPKHVIFLFIFLFIAIVIKLTSILQFADALPIGIVDSRSQIALIMSSILFLVFLYIKLPDSIIITRISKISLLIYLTHPLCIIGQTLLTNYLGFKLTTSNFIYQFIWSSFAILISVLMASVLDIIISSFNTRISAMREK